ncbi:sensor domain-containing protein [Streptomyces sp. NPDC056191]|uniref:sensor domain-containing protein n=1 Tax=Streptomyces sp. NPDC056191 TaxID=3345742 RepID=UPI0035DCED42
MRRRSSWAAAVTDHAGSSAPSRRTGAGTGAGTGTGAATGTKSGSAPESCGGPAGAGAVPRGCLSVRAGEWAFGVAGLPLALLGGVYALTVVYAGALLSLTVLGLPFVALALRGARGWGTLHRWFLDRLLGEYVPAPAGAGRVRPSPGRGCPPGRCPRPRSGHADRPGRVADTPLPGPAVAARRTRLRRRRTPSPRL